VQCPVCLGNGGVPELTLPQQTLAGALGWITGLISHIATQFRARQVAPPKILYQPTAPDVDKDGLNWGKLGFVVIDVDGASSQALYVDENGAKVPIASFGSKPDVVEDRAALR
jgi:hypothetical protein